MDKGKFRKETLGVRSHYGIEKEYVSEGKTINHHLFGINPYYQWDTKWVGIGLD